MLLRLTPAPASDGAGKQQRWRVARHWFIVAADVADALITQTAFYHK